MAFSGLDAPSLSFFFSFFFGGHWIDLTEEFIKSISGIDSQRDAVNSC